MKLVSPALPPESAALFLDVDGTLLDIAPRPDAVVVTDSLRTSLAGLDTRLGGALALVSGRAIADLDTLFAPLRVRASGVHGAELRLEPWDPVETAESYRLPDALVAALTALSKRHPGTLVENKSFSVALHYRAAPEAGPKLREALDRLMAAPEGSGCRILPGHMVFEVKRLGFDKGTAVAAFMRHGPFLGRQPIFIGDDVTDLPGLARALEEGGFAYSVTTPRDGMTGHFPDPASVRHWLAQAAGL